MTPTERRAALEQFNRMPPTDEREALRKAIEASDTLGQRQAHHRQAGENLARLTFNHAEEGKRLAELEQEHADAEPDVRALLVKLKIVEPDK